MDLLKALDCVRYELLKAKMHDYEVTATGLEPVYGFNMNAQILCDSYIKGKNKMLK